jgi:solute:Na+ symporter, SSS family
MLHPIDLIIVGIYLLVMLTVGFFVGRKEDLEGFLVNNRKTKTALLIFTIVSTSVGMGALIGISSAAYQTGISYGLSAILAGFFGLLFVALFASKIKKFGDEHKAHTIGDWFGIRYSNKNRLLVGIVVLIAYFFYLALQFVGVSGLIHVATGIDFQVAMIISSLITIAYVAFAGIKSDFYTDAIQFFVIVFVLFFVLVPASIKDLGGIGFLAELPAKYFDPFAFGGIGFFFGILILGLPMLLVGMDFWQRIYASTNAKEAKRVFIWSALLMVIFLIPAIIIGLAASQLLPGMNPDFALFELMKQKLPIGILGLGIAGVLATAMSTIDSMILVGSATILKDIHKTFINPKLSDSQMLKWVRIYTVGFGLLGLIVAFLIPNIIQLNIIGASTLMVFSPAIIGGFIWKKATAKGSFWSILIGVIVTFALLPIIPKTSFLAGTLLSLILYIIISKLSYKKESSPLTI